MTRVSNYTILILHLLLLSAPSYAQTIQEGESIILKTIRALDDTPVVLQNEVKGGLHHYNEAPWLAISKERTFTGMMAVNTATYTTYQYTGTTGSTNVESDWQVVLLITMYEADKAYTKGDIVQYLGKLYIAEVNVAANETLPATNASWASLSGDTFTMTATTSESYSSGGTEIILVKADYTLAAAAAKKGATVTVKNTGSVKVTISTNGSETIDGASSLSLFKSYDYVTLVSDGSNWYKVGEGGAKITADNANVADDDLDAFYWGDPNSDGSWRIIYSSTANNLIFQRRISSKWENEVSIMP